jgi:hypothetical protein
MTTRPQSEPIEKGLSHRGLVQAAADGLVCNNQHWSVHNDTSWLEEVKMCIRCIRAVLLAIFVTGILAFSRTDRQPSAGAFDASHQRATIIDGLSDAPLRDRSLLIEGNIIRDLVAADASAPPGVQVLDLSGKFIIPGLFDSHVHWQEWMGELYVNHGVTSVMALENVPKALRAKSQVAPDLPRFFHSGGRPPFTESSSDADIRQAVRNWLLNEPDLAWFPQYNDRIARAYAIAADEAHKAGFLVFGHTDDAPGSLRDGIDIFEHIWGFGEAVMSPRELRSFQEGKSLTWATSMTDWNRLDGMIADAVRRGAYLNPTLHYEWGGMSRRAPRREYEDYLTLSNPDLVYFPRNITDSILARHRQIKNFSSRYESMPWVVRLPAPDREEFEAGFRNVLEFTSRFAAAGGVVSADPLSDISNTKKIERAMKNGRWIELGYHPEYVTLLKPAGSLAASTFAPVISSIQPSSVKEGSPSSRVVLEGSGFMMTSLVRVDLPRPAAFGVLSPGQRDRAYHTEPLQRAGARAGRRDYRGPRRCGACFQPASGGRNLEHGSPIGAAKVSVPAPLSGSGPKRRNPTTSMPSIGAR